jgi:hypothetical protein
VSGVKQAGKEDTQVGPIEIEFPKWRDWAKRIEDDVTSRLVYPRQLFRDFAETVNGNLKHICDYEGGTFCKFVQQCYGSHVAMAIRSHVKCDRDSISLKRLLVQIRECANQFTYEFYLRQFPIRPNYVDWQRPTYSQFSKDGKAVSEEIVRIDIEALETLTAQVEGFVDRSLAHLDKRGFQGTVTFGGLDQCVDAFDDLVCKYLKLICGGGPTTLEPTILDDWKQIFTVPLEMRRPGRGEYKDLD